MKHIEKKKQTTKSVSLRGVVPGTYITEQLKKIHKIMLVKLNRTIIHAET